MTSPRGSNGGGEARWSGLVALADLGSRVLSAPAALPACYTAALRRLTPSRRFEGAWSKTAGSLKSGPTTHAVAPCVSLQGRPCSSDYTELFNSSLGDSERLPRKPR